MKGKQDFYIIFLFLSSLIIPIFFLGVCEFDTETSHHFCASAWPAVPLDSVIMRQVEATRCTSKTRDETG